MSSLTPASSATPPAKGFLARARAAFSRAAQPAADALPPFDDMRSALFDEDEVLMRSNSTEFAALPDEVLQYRLALEERVRSMLITRRKADKKFDEFAERDPNEAYDAVAQASKKKVMEHAKAIYGDGSAAPALNKEWSDYMDKVKAKRAASGIIPMSFYASAAAPGLASSTPAATSSTPATAASSPSASPAPLSSPAAASPASSSVSGAAPASAGSASGPGSSSSPAPSSPVITPGAAVDWSDLSSADPEMLLMDLAEGLEYDRFDSVTFRSTMMSAAKVPSLQELIVLCTTYIFVGNNMTRLQNKVKNQRIGERALAICNKFGVMRSKVDSKTVTLARIGIAFSPIVWALRNELVASKKLSPAGVTTTTPVVLQDVALSGVSDKIQGGAAITDFLLKFNRVLSVAAEAKKKEKTTEAERDETANRYKEISLQGAARDPVIQSWDFNAEVKIESVKKFYDTMLLK